MDTITAETATASETSDDSVFVTMGTNSNSTPVSRFTVRTYCSVVESISELDEENAEKGRSTVYLDCSAVNFERELGLRPAQFLHTEALV